MGMPVAIFSLANNELKALQVVNATPPGLCNKFGCLTGGTPSLVSGERACHLANGMANVTHSCFV